MYVTYSYLALGIQETFFLSLRLASPKFAEPNECIVYTDADFEMMWLISIN